MDRKLNCPKCSEPMDEGFTLDRADHHHGKAVSTWIAGAPERSAWVGLKTKDRDNIPIRTFRCSGCGYLESYANNSD
jgi:hypothetical protein